MKRILISFVVALTAVFSVGAQNVVFINTETILGAIPEYVAAQDELNTLSDKYKANIESQIGRIETLYQDYQKNKSSMSASQRTEAENEIISKEKAVKEKQSLYFGENGIMAKKSEELLGPIKSQLDSAIKAAAEAMEVDAVIDLAVNQGVVYYNELKDISNQVIEIYKKTNK